VSDKPVSRLPAPPLTPKQKGLLLEMRHDIVRWIAHFRKKYRGLLEPADVAQLVEMASVEGVRTFREECMVPVAMYVWKHVSGTVIDEARGQVKQRDVVRAAAEKCMNNQRDENHRMKDTDAMVLAQAHALSDRAVAAMIFSLAAESSVRDALAGEDELADREMRTKMRALVAEANLSERELSVLEGHYIKDAEFKDVAEAMKIGYSSARKIHNDALITLGERWRAKAPGSAEADP
jgi:DNA-directed RNA polymerase specialized sigma subunit